MTDFALPQGGLAMLSLVIVVNLPLLILGELSLLSRNRKKNIHDSMFFCEAVKILSSMLRLYFMTSHNWCRPTIMREQLIKHLLQSSNEHREINAHHLSPRALQCSYFGVRTSDSVVYIPSYRNCIIFPFVQSDLSIICT